MVGQDSLSVSVGMRRWEGFIIFAADFMQDS